MLTVVTTRPPFLRFNHSAISSDGSYHEATTSVTQLTAAAAVAIAPNESTATHPGPLGLFRRTMHPDNFLLSNYGVTSPRIIVAGVNLKSLTRINANRTISPLSSSPSSEDTERTIDAMNDAEEMQEGIEENAMACNEVTNHSVIIDDDEVEKISTKKRIDGHRCSKHGDLSEVDVDDVGGGEDDDEDINDVGDTDENINEIEDDRAPEDDAVSLCSTEGSELSVGQENPMECRRIKPSLQHTRRFLAVSDMMSLCSPSAFSSTPASAPASLVIVNRDVRTRRLSTDEAMNQLNEERTRRISGGTVQMLSPIDPLAMASALRMPVALIPCSNTATQLQGELLRQSHLYAEELVKQQVQLMNAARVSASAFALRPPQIDSGGSSAMGIKPAMRTQPYSGNVHLLPHSNFVQDVPTFSGIHSHLSAISKMSQLGVAAAAAAAATATATTTTSVNNHQIPMTACSVGSDALAKLTAFGMSAMQRTPTPTMTTAANQLNQLQAQINNNLMNNNLQDSALKFSIDNILKADFGRRFTDPLSRNDNSGAGADRVHQPQHHQQQHCQQRIYKKTLTADLAVPAAPMDLTSHMTTPALSLSTSASALSHTVPLTFSSTLANICTNSNDSSSTVLSSNCGNSTDLLKSPTSLTSLTSSSPTLAAAIDKTKVVTDGIAESGAGSGGSGSSSSSSSATSSSGAGCGGGSGTSGSTPIVWPAWVYCTRYSDRPSSGPRARKPKKPTSEKGVSPTTVGNAAEDKRPRTAFSGSQLARLKHEFNENRYLTEKRRQQLSGELGLNEAQIKIWFQNKRAKLKKSSGTKNPLALQLMAQGLYNHSTIPLTREEEELQELQERENAGAISS